MEKSRKIILSLIIVVIIILILIIAIIKNLSEEETYSTGDETGDDVLAGYGKTADGGIDKSIYFNTMDCIENYLYNLNTKNDTYYSYNEDGEYTLLVDEENIKTNIYNLLSQTYIERNSITIENIYDKIETFEYSTSFVPLDISRIQDEDSIKSFIVYGLVETTDYNVIDKIFLIVSMDIMNDAYSIEPITGDYSSIEEIEISELETEIAQNETNKYSENWATYEDNARDYLDIFKELALGAPEELYELLDEEYKTTEFGSLEKFEEYIEERREEIEEIVLVDFQVEQTDDYTEYMCLDYEGYYYIFHEEATLKYTVKIADYYTINS